MISLSLDPFEREISAEISVPGSKSITNRALLLAMLAEGKTILRGGLLSDDVTVMMDALRNCGVSIEIDSRQWEIEGVGSNLLPQKSEMYLGNAGTAMRFLTAAMGYASSGVRLYGKSRMHERPLGDLIDGLRQLGVHLQSEKNTKCPPVLIEGKGNIQGGVCRVSGATSSQFLSAILCIAPLTQTGVVLEIQPPFVSRPYVEMTREILQTFGVHVDQKSEYIYTVSPQKILSVDMEIEADASSSAHVFALVMARKGSVHIPRFPHNGLQGDARFPSLLEKMGAEVSSSSQGTLFTMRNEIRPLGTVDMEDMPDVALIAATLASLAVGRTKITGLSTLREKECDRIAVIEKNLQKMGAKVESGDDFLEIFGNPAVLHGATIETHDDHRIAMSFAALGGVIPGVIIDDRECVNKTFPLFWEVFEKMRR